MGDPTNESFAGAMRVLRAFVDANARSDEAGMRACLSKRMLESGSFTGAQNQDAEFTFGEPTAEGESVIIPLRVRPAGAERGAVQELPAVMVRENGEWKFDLAGTLDRLMGGLGGAMEEAMGQMASAMGEAMEGIAGAMKEAFGGEEASWEHVSAEPASNELHSLPGMTMLERTHLALSEALGFPVAVSADIRGLLSELGSDDEQMMKDWLEEQLLVNWPGIFAAAAQRAPVEGRLHGVRIEAAASPRDRFIAADLNDVVYRLNPREEAGYYGEDEVERVLPGILAGLRETMHAASGMVTVFSENDSAISVEDYAAGAGARCMKRISEMLGRNIALDASWREIEQVPDAGGMLMRWGLGRAVGGIALALLDERLGGELRERLRSIRLGRVDAPEERVLRYEEGVLEMSPALFAQEEGCFWEVDIAAAFEGISIMPTGEFELERMGIAEGVDDSIETEIEDEVEEEETEEPEEEVTNDTLFRDAVAGLETAVPAWKMQLDMTLGHDTPLVVDWGTLNGRYELVQGMVHVGVVQALGAIAEVGWDPATKQALAERVKSVRIQHATDAAPGERVQLRDGELVFRMDMSQEVDGPPDGSVNRELRRAIEGGREEPGAATSVPSRGEQALAYMARLEELMRAANLWPGDPPAGPIEVRGAFGCENMAFEQWLAWVLIPRVKEIVASGDSFPSGSRVGAYAVRELDGAGTDEVIGVLGEFDRFIDQGAS